MKKVKKNRKKLLKSKERTYVTNGNSFRLSRLELGYYESTDKFYCKLFCQLGGKLLSIYGYIDDIRLVGEGIRVVGYRTLANQKHYDSLYNCNELALSVSDCPRFFSLVQGYVYWVGDCSDRGSEFRSLSFEPILPLSDDELPTLSELLKGSL